MKTFPTIHCRCPDGHEWATLIPTAWFKTTDIECPACSQPVYAMKAGDWRTLDQVKAASEDNCNCTNPLKEAIPQPPIR